MDDAIISAAMGLVGALIGGCLTYLGVNKQLNFEREKIITEERERQEVALAIIKAFLIDEIKINYEEIKKCDSSGELIKIFKYEVENPNRQIGNFIFNFNDFERIKYDLIKYKDKNVLDTIEIYKAFRFIQENGSKKHFKLSENDKALIKNGINKCERLIKSL